MLRKEKTSRRILAVSSLHGTSRKSILKAATRGLRRFQQVRLRHVILTTIRWVAITIGMLFVVFYAGWWWHTGAAERTYDEKLIYIRYLSYVHVNTGIVYMTLATFQIWPSFRVRNLVKHRLFGKICIVSSVISNFALLAMLGVHVLHGTTSMLFSAPLFSLLHMHDLWKGYAAIRKGKIENHRAHMLRAYCITWAVIPMRPMMKIPQALGFGASDALGAVAPLSWTLIMLGINNYIRTLPMEQSASMAKHAPRFPQTTPVLSRSFDFTECKLVSREPLSSDMSLLRLELPDDEAVISTPPGLHYSIRAQVEGVILTRAYTPIVRDAAARGIMEFAVKKYDGGRMSTFLHQATVGSSISILGPLGGYRVNRNEFAHLILIAGGSGITTMYSVMKAILFDPKEKTLFHLVYCVHDTHSFAFGELLNELITHFPDRVSLEKVIGRKELIPHFHDLEEKIPPRDDIGVLVSGPMGFMDTVISSMLDQGHSRLNCFAFGIDDH